MASHDEEAGFGPSAETTSPDGEIDLLSLLDAAATAPATPARPGPGLAVSSTTGSHIAAAPDRSADVLARTGLDEPTNQDLQDAMNEALAALGGAVVGAPPRPASVGPRPPSSAEPAPPADPSVEAAAEPDDEDSMFESPSAAPRRRRSSAADAAPSQPPQRPASASAGTDDVLAAPAGGSEGGPSPDAVGGSASGVAASNDNEAAREESAHASTERLILALGDLLTVCMAPSPDGHAVRHAAEAARSAIAAAGPPWRLRLFGRAVWRDGAWIALDATAATAAASWTQTLAAIGRTTISCDGEIDARALYEGVRALAIGAHRRTAPSPDGAGALRWVADPARPDAESFAVAAVDGLVELCKELATSPGRWPPHRVVDALDLVEQALDARPGGVMRAIALGHIEGAAPRHAAEVAILALAALRAVEASSTSARAIAHVALGCALTGTAGGQPPEAAEAATRLLARLGVAGPANAEEDAKAAPAQEAASAGAEPLDLHLLRVVALAGWLAAGRDGADAAGPDRLARLLHAIVRRRCAEGRVARPWAELCLVEGRQASLQAWAEALPSLLGATPAGSLVRLPDGSHGVVLEATAAGRLVDVEGKVQAAPEATLLQTRT